MGGCRSLCFDFSVFSHHLNIKGVKKVDDYHNILVTSKKNSISIINSQWYVCHDTTQNVCKNNMPVGLGTMMVLTMIIEN